MRQVGWKRTPFWNKLLPEEFCMTPSSTASQTETAMLAGGQVFHQNKTLTDRIHAMALLCWESWMAGQPNPPNTPLRAKRVLYNLYTKIIQNRSLTKPSHPTCSTLCWASILLPTCMYCHHRPKGNQWIPNLDTPQKINGWKPDNTSLGKVHIIFQTIIFRFELLIFRGVYRFSAECWYFCHPKKKQANHANSWQHLTPSGDPTLLSLSQWNFSSSFQKSGNL